jgi:hypothetical protein
MVRLKRIGDPAPPYLTLRIFIMSRTVKGSKCSSHEYWGKRALSVCAPGRISKKITSSMERMQKRELIIREVNQTYI